MVQRPKYFQVLLYFLILDRIFGQALLRLSDDREVSAVFAMHRFQTSPIAAIAVSNVSDLLSCTLECIGNVYCWSFNFAVKKKQKPLHECQILSSGTNTITPIRLERSFRFHHYSIENPCQYKPCPPNSICQPQNKTDNYMCQCLTGFHGEACEWKSLNQNPVCFGAKDDAFGVFHTNVTGRVQAFKLIHLSGNVSCAPRLQAGHWGSTKDRLETFITDATDIQLTPPLAIAPSNAYRLPGVSFQAKEFVLPGFSPLLSVTVGQEFRVWFGEDLKNINERDNSGTTCCDVFAMYID